MDVWLEMDGWYNTFGTVEDVVGTACDRPKPQTVHHELSVRSETLSKGDCVVTKVAQLQDSVFVDQHVGRFEVAVYKPAGVHVVQSTGAGAKNNVAA